MKNKSSIFLALIGILSLGLSCSTGAIKEKPLTTSADSVSYYIGLSVGSSIKQSPEFAELDDAIIMQGIREARTTDEIASMQEINMYIQQYMMVKRTESAKVELEKGMAFLAENKTKEGVMETESGLQYKVIREGNGAKPLAESTVKVHYEGRLIDGKVFDSSYERNDTAQFALNRVIAGWTEGIQLMGVGAEYEFYIPSELGYGERGAGADIPGNSVLIFKVELFDVVN